MCNLANYTHFRKSGGRTGLHRTVIISSVCKTLFCYRYLHILVIYFINNCTLFLYVFYFMCLHLDILLQLLYHIVISGFLSICQSVFFTICSLYVNPGINPFPLKRPKLYGVAKTLWSFGCFECKRVKCI